MAGGLSDSERIQWLRLTRTPNVGPVTFAQLIARFGSASAALAEIPGLARRGGGDAPKVPHADSARRELDAVTKLGGRILTWQDADYPRGLAALDAPPPVLSVLGQGDVLRKESIAMVGARNASALGRKLAQKLAADLGQAGLAVVSGMARGIDTAAHEGSLATGTCAVVAGGVDVVYPPENGWLYERLTKEGAVVSEMPIGEQPQARHFPRRNRIISGIARGIIVVEAAEGSGSLITARFALEQNREVFAVPGSPLDPRAKGTNRLLREGAVLTECADDVLSVVRPMLGSGFGEPPRQPIEVPAVADSEADQVRALVIEALGPAPVRVDELIRLCAAPAAAVLAVLLELELAGKLTRHPGNEVSWSA